MLCRTGERSRGLGGRRTPGARVRAPGRGAAGRGRAPELLPRCLEKRPDRRPGVNPVPFPGRALPWKGVETGASPGIGKWGACVLMPVAKVIRAALYSCQRTLLACDPEHEALRCGLYFPYFPCGKTACGKVQCIAGDERDKPGEPRAPELTAQPPALTVGRAWKRGS